MKSSRILQQITGDLIILLLENNDAYYVKNMFIHALSAVKYICHDLKRNIILTEEATRKLCGLVKKDLDKI
jgi:hypothetical protein